MSQWMRDERDTNDNPNCSCTIILYLMAYIFILFFNSCFANVHQLNSWSPIKSFRLAFFTDSCFELVDLQLHRDKLTATKFLRWRRVRSLEGGLQASGLRAESASQTSPLKLMLNGLNQRQKLALN
ncbi:hypothetical protein Bpfe_009100 [Biomphalaria pfeifferi]|uniref:Uncharacterized protein n=1 Tax=Biomphalaria pfeifferi TaxID=112525 RepID=A0AAD8FFI1_BIOPF|nr:hypothetical protein Bpfe_009100 [Biomphalaria pfeifferi]